MICDECQALYEEAGDKARDAKVFARVRRNDEALICTARDLDANTCYRVEVDEDHQRVWVGLYTPDRWLSESIETDLLHQGDSLEELLEEELFDQGYEGSLSVEHFRDDQKHYVFRSQVMLAQCDKLDSPNMIDQVTRVLLAYEAMFRQLGDMSPSEDQDAIA